MIKKGLDNRAANIAVMLFTVILVMLGMIYNGIFCVIAFVLDVVFFIFSPGDVIIADIFFLLSFATVYKYTSASTSFVTILLTVVILILTIRNSWKLKSSLFLGIGCLFIAFMVILDILHGSFDVTGVLRHVFGILLVYYILDIRDKKLFKNTIISFGVGVFVSSFISLFADNIPNFYSYVRKVGYDAVITNRFSAMNGDPNYYAIGLILVLLGALLLEEDHKVYFWCSLLFTCYFGVQTYSKSFLLAFVITMIVIVVKLIRNKRDKQTAILLAAAIGAGIYLYASGYFSSVEFLIRRFTAVTNLSDLTTGRWEIWATYIDHIFSGPLSLLFGDGLSADLLNGQGPHNFYIELLYYFGLCGTVLFTAMFVSGYRTAVCNTKRINIGKISVFVLLMLYFALQMVHSNELYFHIGYAFIMCLYGSSNIENRGNGE